MYRKPLCLLIVLFGSFCVPLPAQTETTRALILDSVGGRWELQPYLYYLEDPTGSMDLSRVRQETFLPLPDSFRFDDSDLHLWGRLTLDNQNEAALDWIIWDQATTDQLDFYLFDSTGLVLEKHAGGFVPKSEREIQKYQFTANYLPLKGVQTYTLYFHLQEVDSDNPQFDLHLWDVPAWNTINMEDPFIFLFSWLGMLLIMFLYSFMVFLGKRELTYLFYSIYILCILLFLLFAGGPQQLLFWPYLNIYILITSLSGIGIFYFLFGRAFLQSWELTPKMDRVIRWYILLRVLVLLFQLGILLSSYNNSLVIQIEFVFFFLDAGLSLVWFGALIKVRRKTRLVWFFIAGSSVVFVLGLTYLAVNIVILDRNPDFSFFALAIVVEILIFSLGLGYKMRLSEQEKLAAQAEQLAAQEALNTELSKINTAFGRFVPHEFLRSLGHETILDVSLGDGVEKEVTVLFSDIRDYTGLSERMSPQENFDFLNAYLGRVGPVIKANGGFVNQYYGDGIMALFLDAPDQAIQAAIEMQQVIRHYNEDRIRESHPPIQMGIGIHTGSLMMGVIGDTLRMEAGVVSDTVNTASRMEGLTKHFGVKVLVSQSVLEKMLHPDRFLYRSLGRVLVKGRKQALTVYDFFEGDAPQSANCKQIGSVFFSQGLDAYFAQRFGESARFFSEALASCATDAAARRYLEYCEKYLLEGIPENWDGVERMLSK